MTYFAFSSILGLLLPLGGGLPLAVPPMPEDPLLSRIAPAECLFYTSSAGTATPVATSKNQTEQLLAEPEVQQFLAEIDRAVLKAIEGSSRGGDPQQAAVANDAYLWAKKLLMRPMAIFLSSATLGPTGPDVQGGLVINVGDDAAKLQTTLEKYQAMLPPSMVEKATIGTVEGYQLTMGRGAPAIFWCVKGKYLMAGIGPKSIEGIMERARAKAPEWLTALREQLPIQRVSTVTYINTKKIIDQFAPMGGPQVQTVLDALGLGKITAISSITGLDGSGYLSRTVLNLEGEPTGLLQILAGKPLTVADLAPIPADATLAMAGRLDADAVLEIVLGAAKTIEPRSHAEMLRELGNIDENLGIKLRQDVLKSLGDVWCLYNAPSEGGFLISGLTAVVQVRDRERLAAAMEKLIAPFQQTAAASATGGAARRLPQGRPQITRFQFAGEEIYVLDVGDRDFFLAPAWCLTKNELLVAAWPQHIKARLARGKQAKSIATLPEVAALFEDESGPTTLSYVDTRQFVDVLYPAALAAGQLLSSQMRRERIDFNMGTLPSATALRPHLGATVGDVRHTKAGIEFTNRGPLPSGSLASTVPVAAAVLLPAVSSARTSARRASSSNNLKQIGLAMHMFADANRHLPPAFSSDKEGKPLLSWRVAILPYIEEDTLYKQFHLDEPWDSEQNKTLIPRMPQIFRSPAAAMEPGKTSYLTVRGKNTAFPGKEKLTFADMSDGTSNTIMVVEANPEKAVAWTAPDDLVLDEKDPAVGLGKPGPNGFNAAFCDGSVRFISKTIDRETLKRLFLRNDGEAVNDDVLNAR